MKQEKKIKLSDKQKEVIVLMREGWELGHSHTFDGKAWLQKMGIGRGGETKDVKANTFQAIYDRKLIYFKERNFPTSKYFLTELGKTIDIN